MTGKSIKDFPGGFIPFDKPRGPKPTPKITDDPVMQFCVNVEWLPWVVGSLKAIGRPESWSTSYDDAVIAASEIAALLGDLSEGCGQTTPDKLCLSGTFADEQYGYLPILSSPTPPTGWASGQGWFSTTNPITGGQEIALERQFTGSVLIRSYLFHFSERFGAPGYNITIQWKLGGVLVRTDTGSSTTGNFTMSNSTPLTADEVLVFSSTGTTVSSDTIFCDDWSLCYTGIFPLAGTPATFQHVFDFTVNDGGFTVVSNPTYPNTGTWNSGTGWQSGTNVIGGVDAEVMIISHSFSARTVTSLRIFWNTAAAANGGFRGINLYSGSTLVTTLSLSSGAGSFNEVFFPSVTIDRIEIAPTTNGPLPSEPHTFVTELIVNGQGTDPF
jgi:hypothetical protein